MISSSFLITLLQIFNSSVVCSAFHICVCYLTCVRHALKLGCLFCCILYVFCAVLVLIFQFGQHMANLVLSQEIPRILWNPKVYCRIYKCLPPLPVMNLINAVHAAHPTL